ncbi:MAG: anthranilate synthase family protein [Nocardioidaceae bacterium]
MRALDAVTSAPAYALIQRDGADAVTLLGGTRHDYDRLRDIPLAEGSPAPDQSLDRLVCVPFAQIRERGFEAHQDGTPLSCIEIERQVDVPTAELLRQLPDAAITTRGPYGFETGDDEYADVVKTIIDAEIGHGAGANLVVGRRFGATIDNWDVTRALTVFRRLLERERGSYWTYLVCTGDRYLIGASPERHVSVRGGDVRMNPISGTFRVGEMDAETERKQQLLDFLADEKEVYELFMVVDEELKMMCRICGAGGQVLGPYLKPMSHLVHTEYLLAGSTTADVRDVLRDSMFAATVTGSPVENACRLIKRYEAGGRGYYAGMLALLGRDQGGSPTVDAPIVLRTADVSLSGELSITAGATLVRDSDPIHEVAETHAKAGGILTAFGLASAPATPAGEVADLTADEDVQIALARRNRRLSLFWFNDQSDMPPAPELAGLSVVVLDGEDEFVTMLRHQLHVLGASSAVVRHHEYGPGVFDGTDLAIVGPGPGDPRDLHDPKIAALRAAVDDLLAARRPFLGVCLGHQVLCGALGLDLGFKDIVFQGTQTPVDVLGRRERVGFYNTFVARLGHGGVDGLPEGVSVECDPTSGDVHLLAGPHFRSVQFHAESILTEHGTSILGDLARDVVRRGGDRGNSTLPKAD